MKKFIDIKGARTHNLKNVSVSIPRNKLCVITGMSGSGKSSLAFDTIYAEGQRRYVESLSTYARQFLDQMDKPDVDTIEGLSPAVSVEQKSSSHNPRSTVGTVTEIYDYLRLLFARVGKPYCYECGKPIEKQSIQKIVQNFLHKYSDERIMILSHVVQEKKGAHKKDLDRLRQLGFARVKVNGEVLDLSDEIELDKAKKHSIDVIIDRMKLSHSQKQRLSESISTAVHMGAGVVQIDILDDKKKIKLSEVASINNACMTCGISYPNIEPQMFSFNSPQGACQTCNGLGELMYVDEELVVPNPKISINKGAIVPWFGKKTNYYQYLLESASDHFGIDLDKPFEKLSNKEKKIIFEGSSEYITIQSGRTNYTGFFEGVKSNLMRRYKETDSDWMRGEITKFMSYQECPDCNGARLRKEAVHIKIHKKSIYDLTLLSIFRLREFFNDLNFSKKDAQIAVSILREINSRLDFLFNVGLGYLDLNRKSHTLSGGEAQRIRLATQIGAALVGVTYVLDEPSIGLHQRDNDKLISTLKTLRDVGNTVIVVEHDEDTIHASDYVVDIGPKSGVHGGEVVFQGDYKKLLKCTESITSQYLTGQKVISIPKKRRNGSDKFIEILGCEENNLKCVDVKIPLSKLVLVTGVSGSGKSSLITRTLYPSLMKALHHSKMKSGTHKKILGTDNIDKIIHIDQSPIGRTPRSNPATYTGVFTPVRELFASLPESKARGYKPGRFSFNVKGGRCEDCQGDGVIRIEMHFLPDVFVKCESCLGKRFNHETLEILYKGKSIADVLSMSIEEALTFFQNIPQIHKKLNTLNRVGLGYIDLGQAATTLSGGEAQRIKLARELSKRSTGKTIYFLDEPTTGLHFEDIKMLLSVLNELVDQGNTVLVIEHNLDVIKVADHIIDLGPEGGEGGGEIIATGTPEEVAKIKGSHTGKYLKKVLR